MVDIIYKKISVRSLVDIDVLIKKSALEKVKAVLQENGYIKYGGHPGGTLCVQSNTDIHATKIIITIKIILFIYFSNIFFL